MGEHFEERERRDHDWQWVHHRLQRLERAMEEVMATQADLAQKITDVAAGVDRLIAEVQNQPMTQAELDAADASLSAVLTKLPAAPAPAPAAPVEPPVVSPAPDAPVA